jgi:hypothetical protein
LGRNVPVVSIDPAAALIPGLVSLQARAEDVLPAVARAMGGLQPRTRR